MMIFEKTDSKRKANVPYWEFIKNEKKFLEILIIGSILRLKLNDACLIILPNWYNKSIEHRFTTILPQFYAYSFKNFNMCIAEV